VYAPPLAGAVYVKLAPERLVGGTNVPPVAVHITPVFPGSLFTVADTIVVRVTASAPRFGVIARLIGPAAIAIVAAPFFEVSLIEVAVNVTAAGAGTPAGAVYVTALVVLLESAPHAAPVHPAPEIAHVTPAIAGSFDTLTVKFCVPLVITVGVGGETITAIACRGVSPPAHPESPHSSANAAALQSKFNRRPN